MLFRPALPLHSHHRDSISLLAVPAPMPIVPQDHIFADDAARSIASSGTPSSTHIGSQSGAAAASSSSAKDPHYKPEREAKIAQLDQIRENASPCVSIGT